MTESNQPTLNTEYRKRDRSKKPLIVVLALVVAAALIAAVIFWLNRDQGAIGNGDDTSGGTSATAGSLTVGLTLEPTNLDIRNTGGVALDQILIDNVYQGLVGLKSGTLDEYVPVLAESLPEISDDALTYTFTLRDDATFHSGNALTTDDVLASFADEGPMGLAATLDAPFDVTAIDDKTIAFTLQSVNSQLMWHLANRAGLITEAAYEGDLANTTNGTGPYTLANTSDWIQGGSITLTAAENYWGESPTLSEVVWRYIPDANAAVNAALEGDLDVLAPVVSSMATQFEGTDFDLHQASSTDVFTLGFNTARAPLDDVRVRSALSMAIDSEAIVAAFYGDGKALGSPITDIEPAFEDLTAVNAYDPEAAQALLAEAGVSDLQLTVTMPSFYDSAAMNQVVTQFAEVGVTLSINAVEFGTWLNDVYMTHDFDLSYVDHAEPNDFVNYTNPGYYFGYDNPEVQALYAESIAATDPAQAIDLVKQAARIVADDAPAKWLINYTPTNAVAPHVSGFPNSNTNSRINLAGVTVQ